MPQPSMSMCFTLAGRPAQVSNVVRQPPRVVQTSIPATMNIKGLKNAKPCGSCGGR